MILYIVDDEKNIRNNLHQYIPWHEIGIDKIHTAKNGIEALEKMQKCTPDILLTDIRMPKMNGIQLATTARELYPNCVIIFLSGYADKEYFKSAISLKALDYIEKPIDIQSIKKAILQAIDHQSYQEETSMLKDFFDNNRYDIYQNILLQLIHNQSSYPSSLTKIIKQYNLSLKSDGVYTIIYISLICDSSSNNVYDIRHQLTHRISTPPYENHLLSCHIEQDAIVILFDKTITQHYYDQYLNPIEELLQGYKKVNYSIGIGSTYRGLDQIPKSYQEAIVASSMAFYTGYNRTHSFKDYSNTIFNVSPEEIHNFDHNLRHNHTQKVNDFLTTLLLRISKAHPHHINHVRDLYLDLIMRIKKYIESNNLEHMVKIDSLNSVWQHINSIYLLTDLHKYIKSILQDIIDKCDIYSHVDSRTLAILRYIDEHYHDNQLTVSYIAEQFNLSPAYLCVAFKKAVHITVNQYITNKRIHHSKELLVKTHTKIYEIAHNVGFVDTNYFSTLFKKNVGVNPATYRERTRV